MPLGKRQAVLSTLEQTPLMRQLFVLLAMTLCTSASAAALTLQAGQTGQLGSKQITLLSLKDSRCPINAICIQMGDLTASVLISEKNTLRFAKLKYPEAKNITWTGLRISEATSRLDGAKDRVIKVTFSDERP